MTTETPIAVDHEGKPVYPLASNGDIQRLIDWYKSGAEGFGPLGAYAETAEALTELLELRDKIDGAMARASEMEERYDRLTVDYARVMKPGPGHPWSLGATSEKLKQDTGGGCSVCGDLPVVNVDGTYWLCGPCVKEQLFPAVETPECPGCQVPGVEHHDWCVRSVKTTAVPGDISDLIWRAFRALRRDDNYSLEYKQKLADELDNWLKQNESAQKASCKHTLNQNTTLTRTGERIWCHVCKETWLDLAAGNGKGDV